MSTHKPHTELCPPQPFGADSLHYGNDGVTSEVKTFSGAEPQGMKGGVLCHQSQHQEPERQL